METILSTLLFRNIEIKDEEFVCSKFSERRYPKNQVVFYEDDLANEMYVVKSGCMKIYREDDCKEIILGHQFSGEFFGEVEVIHGDIHRVASVAAIESSVLWMIKKQDLQELIREYPTILLNLYSVICDRLKQANRKIEYLAFGDSRIRVANLLLDLQANFGMEYEKEHLICWRITQQHFANMIGVSRESAARTLQEFQAKGWIDLRNKQIIIRSLPAIQHVAGNRENLPEFRLWHPTF
ncbi:Crp/Fnr family transcriptional regulator [Ammoniphilus sp. CFH 90114]|uniref:Crp/Fnr family transcriptional regulator n=1 Tax=Ammoniphilus sp. CFH 90114 TaxID=2493665 RepID=UPI00100DDD3B|nr:Crp/Fnr family transcriptional regulator [Ammoniphilus sp. CFH 90114]RXT04558.1 Crp/Fnr family transcriptional regulator [Ammoniphilus sp. CFH 90114]